MGKLGDYTNNNTGNFELIEDGWHKVKLNEIKVIEKEDKQSGKMKKKLSCCFNSLDCVNSEGNPFKVFYFPNLEVNPRNDKSKLYTLIMGLFGKIPDDVEDLDIENDLPGKVTNIFVSNTENPETGKTYTNIVKFQLNRAAKKPLAAPPKPPMLNNPEKAVKALALTKMHGLLKDYGLDPKDALETCSNTVGRSIAKTDELTLDEIKNISDFILTALSEKNSNAPCNSKDDPDFVAALQA